MSLPIKYNPNIDEQTLGFVRQLAESAGKLRIASITPHQFYYHVEKQAGFACVTKTNQFPTNCLFYGKILISSEAPTGLDITYAYLDGIKLVSFSRLAGTSQVENILFDKLEYFGDVSIVNASYFLQKFLFTGYKISLT